MMQGDPEEGKAMLNGEGERKLAMESEPPKNESKANPGITALGYKILALLAVQNCSKNLIMRAAMKVWFARGLLRLSAVRRVGRPLPSDPRRTRPPPRCSVRLVGLPCTHTRTRPPFDSRPPPPPPGQARFFVRGGCDWV